jgi:uncharacterized protein with HEPN domain
MKKHWKPYALHIVDCIEKIRHIKQRGDITQDIILYDAVLRNLQTLSEATRHLPESKIAHYPNVPWKEISGFRSILVHDYLGDIDAKTILNVVNIHILPLETAVMI